MHVIDEDHISIDLVKKWRFLEPVIIPEVYGRPFPTIHTRHFLSNFIPRRMFFKVLEVEDFFYVKKIM